jgi:hypothetical protein
VLLAAIIGIRGSLGTISVARNWGFARVALIAFALFEVGRSVETRYFVPDLAKIVLIIAIVWALRHLDPHGRHLKTYFLVAICCVLVRCIANLPGFDITSLAYGARFEFLSLGSFNALGMVLGTQIVMLLYIMEGSLVSKALWALVGLSLFFLLLTLSRGGLIALLASTGPYLFAKRRTFIRSAARAPLQAVLTLVVVGLLLEFAIPSTGSEALLGRLDLEKDATGSGRLLLWADLFSRLLAHPHQIVIGGGIGSLSLEFEVLGLYYVQRSAHNLYLDLLGYFGLIGVAVYLIWIRRLYRTISASSGPLRPLKLAFLAEIVVMGFIDSFWGTAQLLWFSGLLYYVVTIREQAPTDESTARRSGARAALGS